VDKKGEQEGEEKGRRDVDERGKGGEQNTHQAKRRTSPTQLRDTIVYNKGERVD
jgi:hypothetical protein